MAIDHKDIKTTMIFVSLGKSHIRALRARNQPVGPFSRKKGTWLGAKLTQMRHSGPG
jgi:hypothetical protein